MKLFKKLAVWLITIGAFAGLFMAVTRAQDIIDWWKLRDYEPSEIIVSIADNADLSNYGRKLFYVSDPTLLDKQTFGSSCDVGEETIVLGCYVSNNKIYIFDVVEERLNGVEEVTAAHEMLHAAYSRLSNSKKEEIDPLLEEAYNNLTDQRVIDNITSYRNRDPSVVLNELHSILGTEIADLPKDLEEYYSQYFNDRQVVVKKAEAYEQEFQILNQQIEDYDARLSTINGDITRIQADLELQNQALASDKKRIEGLKGDITAYNKAVIAYNKKVATYNTDVNKVKSLVEQYNILVTERNSIAVQEKALVEAIDTRQPEL